MSPAHYTPLTILTSIILTGLCLADTYATPPTGPPTTTREQVHVAIRGGRPVENQVIMAEWLSVERPTDSFGRPRIQLKSCRVLGGMGSSPYSYYDLHFQDVTIEGDVAVYSGAEPLQGIYWKNVEVTGNLILGGPLGFGSVDVGFDHVRIQGTLRMSGGIEAASWRFHMVDVGGGVLFAGFGENEFHLIWHGGRIDGDFLATNIPPRGVTWIPQAVSVSIRSLVIAGRLSFERCSFKEVDLDDLRVNEDESDDIDIFRSPLMCTGRVSFTQLKVDHLNLRRGIFRDQVRFQQCIIYDLRLDEAAFHENVVFDRTDITGQFSVDDTLFEKKLRLDWTQLSQGGQFAKTFSTPANRVVSWTPNEQNGDWRKDTPDHPNAAVWRNLRDAWQASGNLEAANEADYRREIIETGGKWGRWMWGYGYRPWRTVIALIFVVLFCAGIYWTRLRGVPGVSAPFLEALQFSFRTAWKVKFGWEHTYGWFWRTLALLEQIAAKVLLVLFVKALANTSPLLKEITDAVVPFR